MLASHNAQVHSRGQGRQCVGLISTIRLRRTSDQPAPLRRHGKASASYVPLSYTDTSRSMSDGTNTIGFQLDFEGTCSIQRGCYKSRTFALIWRNDEQATRRRAVNGEAVYKTENIEHCRECSKSSAILRTSAADFRVNGVSVWGPAQPHRPNSPEYRPKMTVDAITIATRTA